jgi:hypothetical protein
MEFPFEARQQDAGEPYARAQEAAIKRLALKRGGKLTKERKGCGG